LTHILPSLNHLADNCRPKKRQPLFLPFYGDRHMTKPDFASLEKVIEKAFDERDGISTATRGEVRDAVEQSLLLLDRGEARVAEKQADGNWQVNQWLKKAVLLSFRLNPMQIIKGGAIQLTSHQTRS